MEIECLSCLIHRGTQEIVEATQDPATRFKAGAALLEYLAQEFTPNAVAAVLGTMRDRIIKRISGNPDIYAEKKRLSNQKALQLLPSLQKTLGNESDPEKRFRKACLASIVGNIIEFDIPEHQVDLDALSKLIAAAEQELAIDDIEQIYGQAKRAKRILFLADNAGEIVIDKLLIAELKRLGAEVTVAVKGGPVLNDATLEDARMVSLYDVADAVISTGTDAVGLPLPTERSDEFQREYERAEFIVAKGMGFAETLTETMLRQPHALLLRTKCNPVAKQLGVRRGKNVAKLLLPGAGHE